MTLANEKTIDGVIGVTSANEWRKAITNPDFKLYGMSAAVISCGGNRGPDGKERWINVTAAMHRERADLMWANGADGIVLYNVEYQPDVFREVCRYGLAPEDIKALSRAIKANRITNGGEIAKGVAIDFHWGNSTNGTVSAVVGFADKWQWGLDAKLNGVKAVFEDDSHIMRSYYCENAMGHPFSTSLDKQARRLAFPAGTVRPGKNTLEIAPVQDSDAVIDYAELQLD